MSVEAFPGITKADMPSDKVLTGAVGQIDHAVVVGLDKDGNLYVAAADGDADQAIALLTRAATWLSHQQDAED